MNLTFLTPPNIVFGCGEIRRLGEAVSSLGRKALIVTGSRAMKAFGTLDRAVGGLRVAGVAHDVFDRVEHDPSLDTVDAGVAAAKETDCDVVVGLGGGSSLDAAKAIAVLATRAGPAREFLSGERAIEGPGLPFVAVPTTAGTGAEITRNAVLTDRRSGVKQSLRSPNMVARTVIVDPELTWSLPADVTAHSGMDALTQAVECYLSRAANPIADALSLAAARRLFANIERAVEDGRDARSREAMCMGSLLCGMAFANAALGAVHGLAHPIGIALDLPHGLVCAILLPSVLEFNRPVCDRRMDEVAAQMGVESGADLPRAVRDLGRRVGIPGSFREAGLRQEHLPCILSNCRSGSMKNNPREATDADLETLLRQLM